MRAVGTWKGGYATLLEDGRGHAVTVDLPTEEDGRDLGSSALELAVLALAGCITTIFALVAERRRLTFEGMRVELSAERPPRAPTITSVHGTFRLATRASLEEVETALAITLRTCPVGVLFERAQIPVRVRSVVEPPASASPPVPTVPARGAARR
jgi:putative redox protein